MITRLCSLVWDGCALLGFGIVCATVGEAVSDWWYR